MKGCDLLSRNAIGIDRSGCSKSPRNHLVVDQSIRNLLRVKSATGRVSAPIRCRSLKARSFPFIVDRRSAT
jgi:hypothetical protein